MHTYPALTCDSQVRNQVFISWKFAINLRSRSVAGFIELNQIGHGVTRVCSIPCTNNARFESSHIGSLEMVPAKKFKEILPLVLV